MIAVEFNRVSKERLRQLQEDDDDSDVSVDRDEPMEQDDNQEENQPDEEPSTALVAVEKEDKEPEVDFGI